MILKALAILALAGVVCWCGLAGVVFLKEKTAAEPGKADCIIVLGARVGSDGLSTALLRRVEKALAVYKAGLAPNIIVCGAQGADEPMTEAAAMRDWLLANGVPDAAIFLDDTSTSTEENLLNARAIMQQQGFSTAIVTTNAYHLTRALWIARDVGIDAQGAAGANNDYWINRMKARFRESVSWTFYFLGI